MFRREHILGIAFLCFLVTFFSDLSAQTTSFDATLRDYRSHGWTISAGWSGLINSRVSWEDELFVANSCSGLLDTLHLGVWTPEGGRHLTGGLGHVWILKKPILFDRLAFQAIASKRSNTETFVGLIDSEDTTMVVSTSSINIGAVASAFHTFTISPDLFLELGVGATIKRDFFPKVGVVDSIAFSQYLDGELPELPLFTGSLEVVAGVGFMMWRGRFLRINIATDLLQLNPINGTGKMLWVMNDYRPFRVMINYDLHRKLKAKSCAAPTHSEKSRELFGEDMRGWRKAKNNFKKRKKRRRDLRR